MNTVKPKLNSDPLNEPRRHLYGVHGLTEWHAVIHAGNTVIRIPFTGGTLTGYGCSPATFETSSDAVAAIIERSDYFKKHRIVKLI